MKRLSLILACAAIIGAAMIAKGQEGTKKPGMKKVETTSPIKQAPEKAPVGATKVEAKNESTTVSTSAVNSGPVKKNLNKKPVAKIAKKAVPAKNLNKEK